MANHRKNEPHRSYRFKHRAAGPKASGQIHVRTRRRNKPLPSEPQISPLKVTLAERLRAEEDQ